MLFGQGHRLRGRGLGALWFSEGPVQPTFPESCESYEFLLSYAKTFARRIHPLDLSARPRIHTGMLELPIADTSVPGTCLKPAASERPLMRAKCSSAPTGTPLKVRVCNWE